MINFDFNFNTISVLSGILGWGAIGFFAYRILKKKEIKPKGWKILVVIFVGIFSFTINWTMFDTLIKVPILPLGVWILYFVLNRKDGRWHIYRPFAWLGFWANFIFLLTTLLSLPLQSVIYPENEPSTYISSVENASIITIHPSAKDQALNKDILLEQLHNMKQEKVWSEEWYRETYMGDESAKINERFPYQLIGTWAKWGSGIDSVIYLGEDGKGILISTSKKQYYFRSDDSFFKGGENK